MIITNDTNNKEYFAPSNMDKFIKMDCEYKAFIGGSYVFFKNKIKEYVPNDYDYVIFCKLHKDTVLPPFSYNYKHLADFFTIYYYGFSTPKDFIEFMIYISKKYNSMLICSLFYANVLKYFNTTYKDLEPYIDQLQEIADTFKPKWDYIKQIIKCMKHNKSTILTSEQLNYCYEIYKNSRTVTE